MYLAVIGYAAIMELIDSGLGMGFGTVLAPLLIMLGFPAITVVPSILFSQAIGGLIGSFFHHHHQNADFSKNKDLSFVIFSTILGIIATMISALIALHINKDLLNLYIGLMVTAMGLVILFKTKFNYSPTKSLFIGLLAAFNKSLSGGGFGPVMTGGQIIAGNECKNAIARTTFAEPPICIAGFIVYYLNNGISDLRLLYCLTTGAIIGSIFGPKLTKNISGKWLRPFLGIFILILGLGVLLFKVKA